MDQNTYGLSQKYLDENSVDLQDSRYVVVFVEDGKRLEDLKAFRYNLIEKFDKYKDELISVAGVRRATSLKKNGIVFVQKAPKEQVEVLDRVFNEILEECSRLITDDAKQFKAMYTLEGQKIGSLVQLA